MFKAGIYSICILGTFFCGMALGEWHPVYHRWDTGHTHYGYVSQFMVGLPALPAYVQSKRLHRQKVQNNPYLDNSKTLQLIGELDTPGMKTEEGRRPIISGELKWLPIEPGTNQLRGEFNGRILPPNNAPGTPLKLLINNPLVGPDIGASEDRVFEANVISIDDNVVSGAITNGLVNRSFWNWFQVPLDDAMLERLHGTLGKQFDLALVFTWIAGLLNVLAIWDAYEGPAYGYGDEEPESESEE